MFRIGDSAIVRSTRTFGTVIAVGSDTVTLAIGGTPETITRVTVALTDAAKLRF